MCLADAHLASLGLEAFRDVHLGESILVCGCGESLSLLDATEGFITIGVNDVGRLFTPDYLVVVNSRSQFSDERFQFIESSAARVIFTHLADLDVPHSNVVRFGLGSYGHTDACPPGVLNYTRNSPYVAAGLALHMGARRIGLIGVDFTARHFFDTETPHALASDVGRLKREYAGLARVCRARGVALVNLSPVSRLTNLPRESLERFGRRSIARA